MLLSEISIAQVFSSIYTEDRNKYLIEVFNSLRTQRCLVFDHIPKIEKRQRIQILAAISIFVVNTSATFLLNDYSHYLRRDTCTNGNSSLLIFNEKFIPISSPWSRQDG